MQRPKPLIAAGPCVLTRLHCCRCCLGLLPQLMPPQPVVENMKHPEVPPDFPCGPNTKFSNVTPLPHRFKEPSLPQHNAAKLRMQRPEHPIYQSTSSEIGKLTMVAGDMPMRFYPIEGRFTRQWDSAPSKTRVNTGLNTAIDRSDVHHTYDQGWSGHLGLSDFNIASSSYAKHVVRPTRCTADFDK